MGNLRLIAPFNCRHMEEEAELLLSLTRIMPPLLPCLTSASSLDVVPKAIRGASVFSREERLHHTRMAKNIPVTKLIAFTARGRDAVAPNGAIALPPASPVCLETHGKVQIFHADHGFVEPADRFEGLSQTPEHPDGHARPDKIGSNCKKTEGNSYRPPFQLQ